MWQRNALWMVTICCIILWVSGCGKQVGQSSQQEKHTPIAMHPPENTAPEPRKQRPDNDELSAFLAGGPINPLPMNLLVLGLDASEQRSDVILAVSIPTKGPIMVTSVPRDTRVALPEGGFGKINHTFARGGVSATATAVSSLLKQSYPYHVIIKLDGMRRLVDALGGVPIRVGRAMRYTDKAGKLYIDIKAGPQVLNGQKAEHFVRYRSDGRGDIGRIQRQHEFLRAWAAHLFSEPARLLVLRDGLPSGIRTNMPLGQTLRLTAYLAASTRPVKFSTLPGNAAYVEKVSYWIPSMANTPIESIIDAGSPIR